MATRDIPHPGYREVGRAMHRIAEEFYRDALYLSGMDLDQVFAYIEAIPYQYDRDAWGDSMEVICRPARFRELKGLDCKKKSILVACWAKCRGLGYRFVAVDDTGKGISHVFCDVEETPGNWISMDCTVPGLFKPGSPMPDIVHAEII